MHFFAPVHLTLLFNASTFDTFKAQQKYVHNISVKELYENSDKTVTIKANIYSKAIFREADIKNKLCVCVTNKAKAEAWLLRGIS